MAGPRSSADPVEGEYREVEPGERALAVAPIPAQPVARMPNDREVALMQMFAPAVFMSRLYGVGNPEGALVLMLKGFELGLAPMATFEFIHLINGKPSISPRGALALVYQSNLMAPNYPKVERGVDGEVVRQNGTKVPNAWCKVTMGRKMGKDLITEYTSTFTLRQSHEAGLLRDGSPWMAGYQPNMLLWRAAGFCMDWLFPDITGGLKRSDEFGAAVTEGGDVIEGSWKWMDQGTPTHTPASKPVSDEQVYAAELNALNAEFGAVAVLKAAGGIPKDRAEVAEVRTKLEQQREQDAGSGNDGAGGQGTAEPTGQPVAAAAAAG